MNKSNYVSILSRTGKNKHVQAHLDLHQILFSFSEIALWILQLNTIFVKCSFVNCQLICS